MMFLLPMLIVVGISQKMPVNVTFPPLNMNDDNVLSRLSVGRWIKNFTLRTNRITDEIMEDIINEYSRFSRYIHKDTLGTKEFKEMVAQKVFEKTSSRILKKLLTIVENEKDVRLYALLELEYFIRQNETAKVFYNIGGVDIVIKYVKDKVPSIASAAITLVTTAMQVNPDIQKYIEEFQFIEYLLIALSRSDYTSVPGALHALESYLLNMPNHQVEFLYSKGLRILGNILKHYVKHFDYKIEVIALIGNLAREIKNFPETQNEALKEDLQQIFANDIATNGICNEIPHYLKYEGYIRHEIIVTTMVALSSICYEEFNKANTIQSIKKLKELYNPDGSEDLYSPKDVELMSTLYGNLNILLEKLTKKESVLKKTEL